MNQKERQKIMKELGLPENFMAQVLEGKMETLAEIVANDEHAFIWFGDGISQELLLVNDDFLEHIKKQIIDRDSPEAGYLLARIMEIQAKRLKSAVSRYREEREKEFVAEKVRKIKAKSRAEMKKQKAEKSA